MTGFACVSTASTLLTPVAARLDFILLIILRIVCGIGSVSHVTYLFYCVTVRYYMYHGMYVTMTVKWCTLKLTVMKKL